MSYNKSQSIYGVEDMDFQGQALKNIGLAVSPGDAVSIEYIQ